MLWRFGPDACENQYASVNLRLAGEAAASHTLRHIFTQECADDEEQTCTLRCREGIRVWWTEHWAAQRKFRQSQAAYCRAHSLDPK